MVYGAFTVPNTKNVNFIIVRKPAGRAPWSKKIAPAINKLVRGWYPGTEKIKDWYVEGEAEGADLWTVKATRKFEWSDNTLVEVIGGD